MRHRVVNVIDHRPHIGPGLRVVLFPIRQRLVHVKNRFIPPETDLIEERNCQSKRTPQRFLVIAQRLCELPLNVTGRISTTLQEQGTHERMDQLRCGLDSGGANEIPPLRTKMLLERILRRQAPKNVACADKKNRPR